jgi:NAD-dependent SIR2 family protein deacetylase
MRTMTPAEFLRLYPMRARNLMWLLGAGASASAGVPTASHMIWEFKRTLYCSAQHVSLRTCSDLSSAAVRARLQAYFDRVVGYPAPYASDEYAHFFEAAYPAEQDRRQYIERCVSGAHPSYGHLALAALMKLDMVRLVWTTNFDRAGEDAAIEMLGGSAKLVVTTLDTVDLTRQAIDEGRWPLIVKLHGDFQSRRLKNAPEETRAQDIRLRECLVERCRRQGLVVVGYSGRDDSVIDALEEAIGNESRRGYPAGLFWFHRSDGEVAPRVSTLIKSAQVVGIDAQLITVETFDELLADVLLLVPDVPNDILNRLSVVARRVSDAPLPASEGTWPVVRLNALPLLLWPTQCRRVVCQIGGAREVRDTVAGSGADIIAARRNIGVLAFGADREIRKAFDARSITDFDLHAIEAGRLRYESAELGLLYQALARAIGRERGLKTERRRSGYIAYVDPDSAAPEQLGPLRDVVGEVTGVIAGTTLKWAEGVALRLEYRFGRLFLLFEPTIWAEPTDDDKVFERRRDFIRERLAGRFNATWNGLLDSWVRVIVGDATEAELRAFGIAEGVDAVFQLSRTTAFSRRARR